MAFLDQLKGLFDDPPPAYVFEIAPAGIAWAIRPTRRGEAPKSGFRPFAGNVLSISPARDNVIDTDAFGALVASLAPASNVRRRRDAAIILPDYCARIAVLDFDSFPNEPDEQASLVRFRMKKTVPFDVDTAAVSFNSWRYGKRFEVVAAAAAQEIVAKYEAPFRAAGYLPGFCTTSMLAAVDLMPRSGLNVAVKLCDRVLTVALCDGRHPKLVRCVELEAEHFDEIMGVLYPTLAYAEDELKRKPERMMICGFGESDRAIRDQLQSDLGIPVERMRTLWGDTDGYNSGLMGWLQAQEAA
jgi:type IV pilus assembly protein PilM